MTRDEKILEAARDWYDCFSEYEYYKRNDHSFNEKHFKREARTKFERLKWLLYEDHYTRQNNEAAQ